MGAQLLDPIPVLGIFVIFAVVTLICYEVGFRIGRWWQAKMPGEQEGPTGVLVGSLLGLMAFILAITMGRASDRFDARRGNVLADANAIQAVYLQAGYLPDPQRGEMRDLARTYLPLRIATSDASQVRANLASSIELQDRMWAITEEVARPATARTSCPPLGTRSPSSSPS